MERNAWDEMLAQDERPGERGLDRPPGHQCSGLVSGVQTGFPAVGKILLVAGVRGLDDIRNVGCEFAVDQNQMSQQAAPVEIHRTGTQRHQLHQYASMRLAMERVGTACQTFHQCFLASKAGFGARYELVQRLDQTLPGSFLQIHPKHFDLRVYQLVAKLAEVLA